MSSFQIICRNLNIFIILLADEKKKPVGAKMELVFLRIEIYKKEELIISIPGKKTTALKCIEILRKSEITLKLDSPL